MENRTHNEQAEILFITSYPPRVCGIATYSQDLIRALNNKFSNSLSIRVCALESDDTTYAYPEEVKLTLKTSVATAYKELALMINSEDRIKTVLIQHEFGFFNQQEQSFLQFLYELSKPIVIVFHTVLPSPDNLLKVKIKNIAAVCEAVVVMTRHSAEILTNDYGLPGEKISLIAHGTHLVSHLSKKFLKEKYGLSDRKVLTTFGLLSAGKSIETTIEALPAIVRQSPDVMFLVIGKTHPEVVRTEGERYRYMLEQKVRQCHLQRHVMFINEYLDLPELLEYLQLTDIYLFTTNDPYQAVSGTFVYAMSCACPIIATPIPHAKELINGDTGIIVDFRNPQQLADAVIKLLGNETLRRDISIKTLEKIVPTAWENSAVAHALLFEKISGEQVTVSYNYPPVKLDHLRQMTTKTGIIQFSRVNQPDISTGYTLDDNARALVAACMNFKLTGDETCLHDILKYLGFIRHCIQPGGNFLNYTDKDNRFTNQNLDTNLDDSNGMAIWALGYVVSLIDPLPLKIIAEAETLLLLSLQNITKVHSTRAMAFAIKGLYYYQGVIKSPRNVDLVKIFADRLVQMYRHESCKGWEWFEGYLTYANSILPEAVLYAWLVTGDQVYKEIAVTSMNFLLSKTFNGNGIEVISNKKWLLKGETAEPYGEQPIDVAYTIMTLGTFYDVFMFDEYRSKMDEAFNWFLGQNRLHQIIYNPCTGGCYDGLEEFHVNLNQGAESTVSYLMARLTMEKYRSADNVLKIQMKNRIRLHSVTRIPAYSTNYKNL